MSLKKTSDEVVKETAMAKRYAERRGFCGLAEDFSQDYAVKLLSGRKQTVAQCFIEFCRKELGDDKKNKHKKEYVVAEKVNASFCDIPDIRERGFQEKLAYGLSLLGYLTPIEKAIFMLHHYYGLDHQELAICFGYGYASVTHKLRQIEKKLG